MATKKWGSTKNTGGGNSGDIRRLLAADIKVGGEIQVRLVGDVLPNYIHWIQTHNGWRTRNACNFDRNSEEFDTAIENPIEKHVVPQFERADAQFAYVTNLINREDGQIYLMELKQSIYRQIVEYATKDDFGDPSDPTNGYDFTIQKISTGPKKQNVKYQIFPSRNNTPLTEDEAKLPLYDLERLYQQELPEEQLAWLRENTGFLTIDVGSDIPGDTSTDDLPF